MSFTTQIDYVVTGLDKLNTAVANLNNVSTAQNKLATSSNELTRQLITLTSSGFEKVTKAITELSAGFTTANTAAAGTTTSVKTLTTTTDLAVKSLSDLSAKYTAAKATSATMQAEVRALTAGMREQSAAAVNSAEKLTYLATSSSKAVKELRELFIVQQSAAAQENIAAAGYARISALVGERAAAESGLSGVLAVRIAEEEALTAVVMAREAVDAMAIRNDQTRIIATSKLTDAQKIAAMASLGLIDANDSLLKSTNDVTEAENKRLKGMADASEAYAKVGKDHDIAIRANKLYAAELGVANQKQAELITGLTAGTKAISSQSTTMTTLHGILRGVGASTGALALTYGALVPTVVAMASAFVTVGTAIKSVKVGAEFDDMARYIEAIDVQAGGAEMSLGEIKSRLLEIKGVSQTPAELATAVTNLAKAGISAEVAIENVADMSKFAAVVQTDLGEASKLVTSQWAAWGPASETGSRGVSTMNELMNMLAVTVNESRAGMEDLQIAVKYLASLSGTTEATYSDLLAMAGVFANLGLEGSTGAAAARTALVKLQSTANDTVEDFAKLGVIYDPFVDATKTKLKQGSDLLVEFFSATAKLSPSMQADMIDTAIGIRGLSAAALTASGGMSQSFEKMKEAIESAADTAELKTSLINTMFEKLADGSVKKFAEMQAGIQRAMAEAFNSESVSASMDEIVSVVDSADFKNAIGALAEATASFIAMLAKISSVAAPAFGYLAKGFRDVFESINKVIGLIRDPKNWTIKVTLDIVSSLSEGMNALSNPIATIGKKVGTSLGASLTEGVKGAFDYLTASGNVAQQFGGSLEDSLNLFNTSVKDSNAKLGSSYADLVLANANARDKIKLQNEAAAAAEDNNVEALIKTRNKDYDSLKALYTAEQLATDEVIAILAEYRNNQLNGADAVKEMTAAKEKDAKASDTSSKAIDELTRANNDLAKAQVDAMPDGLDKDLAAWAADYAANVAKVADSHRIGTEAAEKYYASFAGTKAEGEAERVKKWLNEYFDAVTDLSNQLDSLAGKDKSLSVYEKELEKISNGFDKWKNSAEGVAERLKGQTNPAVVALRGYLEALINKAEALEPAMKAAFNAKLIEDFDKELKDLNESYSDDNLTSYEKQLKKINDDYDDKIEKAKEIWETTDKSAEAEATLTQKINETNEARQVAIENNTELAKTGDSVWKGFIAGAKDAAKNMTTLGTLGYEAFGTLETAWKDGFYAVITGDMDSLSDVWDTLLSSLLRAFSDFVAQLLLKWAAAKILDMTINVNGSSSGYGGILEAIGSLFSSGDSSSQSWSGSENASNYASGAASLGQNGSGMWATGAGYLGMAAGAYGVYSGVSNLSQGNYGSGSLQTGLGAVSMYKGAVAANMIEPGTATALAKSWGGAIKGYFADGAAAEIGETVGVKAAAAYYEATAGGQVSYGMGSASSSLAAAQAQAAMYSSSYTGAGAVGGTIEMGGAGGGAAAGGAMAGLGAVGAFMAIVYALENLGGQEPAVSPSDTMNTFGMTPDDLTEFSNKWGLVNNSVLDLNESLDQYGVHMQKIDEVLYNTEDSMLYYTTGLGVMASAFDESTQTWSEAAVGMKLDATQLGASAQAASSLTVTAAASIMSSYTGTSTSMNDAASIANAAANAYQDLAVSESGSTTYAIELQRTLEAMGLSSSQAAQAAQDLISQMESEANASSELAGASEGASTSIGGFAAVITESAAAASTAASTVSSSMSSLTSTLGGFATAAGSTADSLRKAVGSWDEAVSSGGSRAMGGIIGRANGGAIGLASGGMLTGGSGMRDDLYIGSVDGVKYMAMGGEFVVNKRATANNRELLEAINDGKTISGGSVQVIHNHFYVDAKEIATTIMPAVDKQVTAQARRGALTKRTAY